MKKRRTHSSSAASNLPQKSKNDCNHHNCGNACRRNFNSFFYKLYHTALLKNSRSRVLRPFILESSAKSFSLSESSITSPFSIRKSSPSWRSLIKLFCLSIYAVKFIFCSSETEADLNCSAKSA